MAKINIPRLPDAPQEYTQSQMALLIQTLHQQNFLLNNTYTPVAMSDTDEQMTWFMA